MDSSTTPERELPSAAATPGASAGAWAGARALLARHPAARPLFLAVAVALAYANTLAVPFHYDDLPSIVHNPHVPHLWPLTTAMSAPPQTSVSGRPVLCFSLALCHAVGGWQVGPFHAFNLAVHLAATLALFALVRRTLSARALPDGLSAHAAVLAFVVALLWGLHPLPTQGVTYLTQRAESLCSLFLLLTVLWSDRAWDGARPRLLQAGAVAACFLSMMTKEVGVVAPILVLLHDGIFRTGSYREALRRRAGFYAALAACWIPLGVLVAEGGRSASAGFHFAQVTPLDYLRTQCGVILHYLRLVVWPHPLVIDYGWPIVRTWGEAWPEFVAMLLAGAGVVLGLVRRAAWSFAGALFFLVLAPSSSIVPIATEVVAEHRMYLPLAACLALLVVGVARAAARAGRLPESLALAAVLAAVCAGATWQRNTDYATPLALWGGAVRHQPGSARAHTNYGLALTEWGKLEQGMAHYRTALAFDPRLADAHYNLGTALTGLGRLAEAVESFRRALEIHPAMTRARYNLAWVRMAQGDLEAAEAELHEVLRLEPGTAEALVQLGIVRVRREDPSGAEAAFAAAIRARPDLGEARFNRAHVLLGMGREAEAVGELRHAAALDWEGRHAALLRLTWVQASSRDERVRDGAAAAASAERLLSAGDDGTHELPDVAAAAFAAAGRFEDAARLGRTALERARAAGDAPRTAAIEARLQLYAAGKAYFAE